MPYMEHVEQEPVEVDTEKPVTTMVLESAHPYGTDIDGYTTVAIPGAMAYMVVFDDQSALEAPYDYLR